MSRMSESLTKTPDRARTKRVSHTYGSVLYYTWELKNQLRAKYCSTNKVLKIVLECWLSWNVNASTVGPSLLLCPTFLANFSHTPYMFHTHLRNTIYYLSPPVGHDYWLEGLGCFLGFECRTSWRSIVCWINLISSLVDSPTEESGISQVFFFNSQKGTLSYERMFNLHSVR